MITPLGVLLFGTEIRTTRVKQNRRYEIKDQLGGAFPVLETMIRHADKAQVQVQVQAKDVDLVSAEHAAMAEEIDLRIRQEAAL